MRLSVLVGNGKKVMLLALPFLVVGVVLNVLYPAVFSVGGPSLALAVISIVVLIPGVVVWLWSITLILTKVPKKQLITTGPYRIVKHPLYAGVALLVVPWAGFLLNTWVGAVVGIVLYIGSRIFAPEEEKVLAKIFGAAWDDYTGKVLLPWL